MKPLGRVKSLLSSALGRVAITGILDAFEDSILARIPLLLDPDVLPPVARPRRIRGSRASALCNPYIPFHRSMYWFGRLHERGLDDFLRAVLKPGDTFIDVGANFGQVTLLGAVLVGRRGRVHAFEPNPELAAVLDEHARTQDCSHVVVHMRALGSAAGEFTLHVNPNHLGASTLRELDEEGRSQFHSAYRVQVVRGDDLLLSADLPGRIVLKIDVEGHEPAVIAGMSELIRQRVDAMVIEVTPAWQGGPDGVGSMFQHLGEMGLQPYRFNRPGARPLLVPLREPREISDQTNVVLVRRQLGAALEQSELGC